MHAVSSNGSGTTTEATTRYELDYTQLGIMLGIQFVMTYFILRCGWAIVKSGITSLFVCYAEHADTLEETHPELAEEFAKATGEAFLGGGEKDPELRPTRDVTGFEGGYS